METHLLEFTDTDEEESNKATVQFGIPKRLRLVLARTAGAVFVARSRMR
jgi:hypothetical protein